MNNNPDPCPGCPGGEARKFKLDAEKVRILVDEIPILSEHRADDEVIAKRIAACLACDAIREELLCAHCGCFIRFRTRSNKSYCPHPAGAKW